MAETPTPSIGDSPVERAFRVLQIIVATEGSVGVRELGRRSGLPRSTVGRLVTTLTDLGMVARTSEGAVVPGSALATLNPKAANEPMLADLLRPLLVELVQQFDENAGLSIDDGSALLYTAQVSADHPVTVPDVTGEQHLFHLVAPGLVTMAWWNRARLRTALSEPLASPTPTSMTSAPALRARLQAIREDGFCWTDEELDIGVNGLAVPVVDENGLVATISLFGPSYRFNPAARPTLARELVDLVAARAPSLLGWSREAR